MNKEPKIGTTLKSPGRHFWYEEIWERRGWIITDELVATRLGYVEIVESKLAELTRSGVEPAGLFKLAVKGEVAVPFLDEGMELTVLETAREGEKVFVSKWMLTEQYQRLVKSLPQQRTLRVAHNVGTLSAARKLTPRKRSKCRRRTY